MDDFYSILLGRQYEQRLSGSDGEQANAQSFTTGDLLFCLEGALTASRQQ
jgi:hypothetical protein